MKYSVEYPASEICLMPSPARLKLRAALPITAHHGCTLSAGLISADRNFAHLVEVMFVRFLHCQVTLSTPFPHCILWKEVTMGSLHLRSSELCSTSEGGVST